MKITESTLGEEAIRCVVKDMLEGLIYLHANNKMHRGLDGFLTPFIDIKSANVLLTGDGRAKLADFGVSGEISEGDKKKTAQGSPYWMAPEVILEEDYDDRADVWSLGITILGESLFRSSANLHRDGPGQATAVRCTSHASHFHDSQPSPAGIREPGQVVCRAERFCEVRPDPRP